MEFSSKDIEPPNQESPPLSSFKLSLSLIHHFRSFQQENHSFLPNYLSKTAYLLEDFKLRNKAFLSIESHLLEKEPKFITLDLVIIAIHYYFGAIANLETLLSMLKVSFLFPSLSKSHVNKTNIMTPLNISNALKNQEKEALNGKNLDEALNLSESIRYLEEYTFHLLLEAEHTEKLLKNPRNELSIDLELFTLTLKAKGKIDPYLVSYICSRLNYKHSLKLHSILFATFRNPDCKTIYTEVYGEVAIVSAQQQKKFSFTKDKYLKFRQILVSNLQKDPKEQSLSTKTKEILLNLISEIESDLCTTLMDGNEKHLFYIEKLLIGMLGYPEEFIRDAAISYLNVLYDEVDWQLRGGFKPKIKCVGDEFKVEYLIESDPEDNNTICFQLNAPPLNPVKASSLLETHVTWHKPKIIEFSAGREYKNYGKYIVVSLDLGCFTKCGFYDWKLVKIQKNGKVKGLYKVYDLNELSSKASLSNLKFDNRTYKCKPIHGRFIVHPSDARSLQIHEVFVDLEGNKGEHTPKLRGSFYKVKDQIFNYKQMGINCLYLMGALERDNGLEINPSTGQKSFQRPQASSLAVTCRKTPCRMLGGNEGFESLCEEARKNQVKIVIDSLTKVSSARPHRKYKDLLLYCLDDEGKSIVCFGTDGRSINYEDTALLNHRKKKVWDLLVSEIIEIADKFKINGVHLENGQAWPQILSLDLKEMYRRDSDNCSAYTEKEIFQGEVVLQDENCGYWASNAKNQYANPFLIKLCKGLWRQFPEFLIIAEAWGGRGFEGREFNIVKSGPIPRMFDLPIALSTLFGKKLRRDGNIVNCEKTSVNVFRTWYENVKKYMPKGSLLIQSTTSHIWPYPVHLYRKATMPIIDLFFLLPDIPMTFIGENDGESLRLKTTNIFTKISIKPSPTETKPKEDIKGKGKIIIKKPTEDSDKEEEQDVCSEQNINYLELNKMKMVLSHKQMHMHPLQLQLQGAPLQYQILNKEQKKKDGSNLFKKTKSERKIELDRGLHFLNEEDEVIMNPTINNKLERKDSSGKTIYKVSSGVSISDLGIQQIKQAEEILLNEVGTEAPFDLKKISMFLLYFFNELIIIFLFFSHYQHRRMLRQKFKVLQDGNFIPISAEHDDGWHTHVMAFARVKGDEIAIIAINFNDYLVILLIIKSFD